MEISTKKAKVLAGSTAILIGFAGGLALRPDVDRLVNYAKAATYIRQIDSDIKLYGAMTHFPQRKGRRLII